MAEKKLELDRIARLQRDQFETLLRISRRLNDPELQDNLIGDALDLMVEVLGAERGLFARYDQRAEGFVIIAARHMKGGDISDPAEFSKGILHRVIREGRPVLVHDVQSDPEISQFDSVQIQNITSVVGVPIYRDQKIWGVILADSRINRRSFSQENLEFLRFFSNILALALDKIERLESLQDENSILKNQLKASAALPDMVGNSPALIRCADLIRRVAATDATALLLGESGTGKELAARAIHRLSGRVSRPFLAQSCSSIPETLLESELFGYRRGAFSGAQGDKKGLFEVASGGTFFLDEIGDVTPSIQAKLLRVLQNQEIMRLGDTQVKSIDVRIIAATNRDLKELCEKGEFRQDLYYRLNVFPIVMPALRERREDIALLADFFIDKYADRKITLDADALRLLQNHAWPGNVRQLENVIRRALILCDGPRLKNEHIVLEDGESRFSGTLEDYTRQLLLKRLREFDGNRTKTARSLGVSVRWVQLQLKKMAQDREGE